MTLPTIVPLKWTGATTDFLKTKVDRQGVERAQRTTVSVPSGTTTTTLVGLVPFNANFAITGFKLWCQALGTGVTASLGVVYNDNINNTNNATLYLSASTAAAAGGELAFTASDTNVDYVTTADGWIVVTIGGATTGSTNSIHGTIFGYYDAPSTVEPN